MEIKARATTKPTGLHFIDVVDQEAFGDRPVEGYAGGGIHWRRGCLSSSAVIQPEVNDVSAN